MKNLYVRAASGKAFAIDGRDGEEAIDDEDMSLDFPSDQICKKSRTQ